MRHRKNSLFLLSFLFLLVSFPLLQTLGNGSGIGIQVEVGKGREDGIKNGIPEANHQPENKGRDPSLLGIQGTPDVENETILPDKVYTFLAPQDNLTFHNITLDRHYDHYFHIEIVTPHNCTIEIRVSDPDDKKFVIFKEELNSEDAWYKSYSVPFGTAISGNYTIKFLVHSLDNLNLYIRMEKTWKCLYDKIGSNDAENLVFYTVNRCENKTKFSHNIELTTDIMYKFYIGRVSAIAIMLDPTVRIDSQLEDPNEVPFIIHRDTEIPGVADVEMFKFGTAVNGTYTFNLTVYCEVDYINLAYCVAEEYQITEGTEPNGTEPVDDTPGGDTNSTDGGSEGDIPNDGGGENNETDPGSGGNNTGGNNTLPLRVASIPKEWMFGAVAFFGGLMTFAILVIVYHKKKSAVKLNL